ncbi:MAG: hypothetical protein KKC21_07035 [Nitrospinae bacterium]|nr:hypothetical protein [Nitrospinota bacterium]
MGTVRIKNIVIAALTAWLIPLGVAKAELPEVHGFLEAAYGYKLEDDGTKHEDFNLSEQRGQLKTQYYFDGDNYLADKGGVISFKGDFLVDQHNDDETEVELRELNLAFTPHDMVDLKAGLQVLTWGTGDYLFINDLFPKDYISFFTGRDDEYLKKPSYALKASLYPALANVDLVAIPYFTPNTIPEGDRLSFFDSFQQGIAGTESERTLVEPTKDINHAEYAARVYKNVGGNEFAFYYFRGFDKNPRSYLDEANRELYYQKLNVYGASIRGAIAGGIGNIEVGYYESPEDTDGTDRMIENSSFKAMTGYEVDLGSDLKVGFQYLYERKLDYDNYKEALLPNDYYWDEHRHLLTNRITKLLNNQTVRVSLFTFYSPSDNDGYFRPSVSYDITDQWKVTTGANLPWGEDYITEFGGMEKNKNIYARVRYTF